MQGFKAFITVGLRENGQPGFATNMSELTQVLGMLRLGEDMVITNSKEKKLVAPPPPGFMVPKGDGN